MCIHFCGDQLLQLKSVQVAKNKSTLMLLAHVFTWALCLFPFSLITGWLGDNWAMIAGYTPTMIAIHFITEWLLGRLATTMYYDGKIRMFILLTAFENLVIMISMILLFNCFI